MKYNKRITPLAERDIAKIRDYIAKDNPFVANKVVKIIYKSVDVLQEYPFSGASAEKMFGKETDYRFWVVNPYPYMVFYKLEDEYISVYRVVDGRSDFFEALGLTE